MYGTFRLMLLFVFNDLDLFCVLICTQVCLLLGDESSSSRTMKLTNLTPLVWYTEILLREKLKHYITHVCRIYFVKYFHHHANVNYTWNGSELVGCTFSGTAHAGNLQYETWYSAIFVSLWYAAVFNQVNHPHCAGKLSRINYYNGVALLRCLHGMLCFSIPDQLYDWWGYTSGFAKH